MAKQKIIFMGTPDFGLPALDALRREFDVCAIVTRPDRPAGRGQKVIRTPVKNYALEHCINVFQPESATDAAAELAALEPDFILTAAFGQLLKREILDIPRKACINIHASLLPKLRGASPINQAVIQGEKRTGVTTFIMDEGMDTGDILLKVEVEIGDDETAGELHDRLAQAAREIAVRSIADFDSIVPIKQDESKATYSGKMKKVDGRINWTRNAVDIRNRVRGCAPWPSAFTFHNGKFLKIWRAENVVSAPDDNDIPGTVQKSDENGILVSTGGGALLIREVQLEGRKRQSVDSFLRGYTIKEGDVFGSYG